MRTVCHSTCEVIGGVVVALVWDFVDPAARTVGAARRALRDRSSDPDRRRSLPRP